MKRSALVLLVAVVVLALVGPAFASEMSGTVTAVDAGKGSLSLKSQTFEANFDCETGSIIKDVKVGDQVTVEYKEVDGKKKATKVTPTPKKPKAAVGC
jgi:hypothetical protein